MGTFHTLASRVQTGQQQPMPSAPPTFANIANDPGMDSFGNAPNIAGVGGKGASMNPPPPPPPPSGGKGTTSNMPQTQSSSQAANGKGGSAPVYTINSGQPQTGVPNKYAGTVATSDNSNTPEIQDVRSAQQKLTAATSAVKGKGI